MTPVQTPQNRNEPCPCGSGKKFKKCCYGKVSPGQPAAGSNRIVLIAVAAVAVAGVVYSMLPRSSAPATSSARPTNATAQLAPAPGLTPPPWYHDTAANRHWHPEHGHWHDGPPPALSADGKPGNGVTITPATASTDPSIPNPGPWYYDAPSNKHWHPGHGHWHDGPPPPESERNASANAQPQIIQAVPVPTPEPPPAAPPDEATQPTEAPGSTPAPTPPAPPAGAPTAPPSGTPTPSAPGSTPTPK